MKPSVLNAVVKYTRFVLLIVMCAIAHAAPGFAQSGLDVRPAVGTCVAGDAPAAGAVILQPVWPELGPAQPFYLQPTPGVANEYHVVSRAGRMHRFTPGQAPVLVLDINALVGANDYSTDPGSAYEPGGSEHWGLVSFAFHPNYAQNGYVYVLYNGRSGGATFTTSFVDRFTRQPDGSFAARQPIFSLPQPLTVLHHLGHLAFGPDGFLYISSGDGTENGWAPTNPPPAQNLGSFYGKILRLDVDNVWPGMNYAIPWNNPFIGVSGTRWEVYALGVRNPWRFSFDPVTGKMMLGDVGYATWEEVDVVDWGANLGWPVFEANECVFPGTANPETGQPCTTRIPDARPAAEFNHNGQYMGVIGGHVYRGGAIPALNGRYIFGLYGPNTLHALDMNTNQVETILDSTPEITSFFTDAQNELYAIAAWEGNVYRVAAGGPGGDAGIPQLLSQTGCVVPSDPRVAQGMIPFRVNSQLWSDGAAKQRWIAVPDGQQITVETDEDFTFPVGSVLMKEFSFNGVPFETRLMKHHNDGTWAGYSYRWEGADARLVSRAGEDVVVIDNTGTPINWRYPSRGECLICHTQAAGVVLGPELAQINGAFTYPSTGRTGNQLDTWDFIGMFDAPLPAIRPALTDYYDPAAPITDRARSYMHSNCAGCHRPNNTIRATIDLKYYTPVPQMNVCNIPPNIGNLGIPGANLITPGQPGLSVVPLRMKARGANQMPPLGTQLVDAGGVNIIESWIRQMDPACN